VLLDDLELHRREAGALEQDRVGHADLADVVEHRGAAHPLRIDVRDVEPQRDALRQPADAPRVLARRVVAVVGGEGEAVQDVGARLLQLHRALAHAQLQLADADAGDAVEDLEREVDLAERRADLQPLHHRRTCSNISRAMAMPSCSACSLPFSLARRIRSRISGGTTTPGTSFAMNSALRAETSGQMPATMGIQMPRFRISSTNARAGPDRRPAA
jgi:hypothetical protein